MDSIITLEGRRQIVGGKLKIEFASFSDRGTFYEADVLSGSSDASNRIFFEAASLPSDQITFENDDSGKLFFYEGKNDIHIKNGKIVASGSFLTDVSQFASTADILLENVLENYCNLRSIGTNDFFRDDKNFIVSQNDIEFNITEDFPLGKEEIQRISVDKADSLFEDKRLSHIKNFKYLPPVNLSKLQQETNSDVIPVQSANATVSLGNYSQLGDTSLYKLSNIISDLKNREKKEINFIETSRYNNIFCQMFEINGKEMTKLDVIDFGLFNISNKDSVHVFFVGKIITDNLNRTTFVNMFTLLFE